MPKPRIPTELKKKKGTYNVTLDKDRIDDKLPALMKTGIPEIILPPSTIPKRTEGVWYRVSSRLSAAGIWTDLDNEYLEQTCIELNHLYLIENDIEKERIKMELIEGDLEKLEGFDIADEQVQSEIARLREELEYHRSWWSKLLTKRLSVVTSFTRFGSKLGMSPADRASLKLTLVTADRIEKQEKPKSPLLAAATRRAERVTIAEGEDCDGG